jgi:hypothetical protein
MRQMTPEQRADAIARIMAVVEAKRAEDDAAAEKVTTVAKVKTEARRAACKEYTKRWHAKCKAEREADPALRAAYLEQQRIKERAYYKRKKEQKP